MKIDGLEFMDWLHKIRKESEIERRQKNLSGIQWLEEVKKQADMIMQQQNLKKRGTKGKVA